MRLCVIYAIVVFINYNITFIIISSIYYDRSGYGSVNTIYQDAKKKDKRITVNDVKKNGLRRMLKGKNNCQGIILL